MRVHGWMGIVVLVVLVVGCGDSGEQIGGVSGVASASRAASSEEGGGSGSGEASTNDDSESRVDAGLETAGELAAAGRGSCRSSEVFGAAGGFPAYADPVYAPFRGRSVAVMTSGALTDAAYVLHVFDISPPVPAPNFYYDAPRYHHPSWVQGSLGRIFGLTLDSAGNIYVAATTVYGPSPDPGTIKRIDGVSGEITDFVVLPNAGPALGNLNYDCVSETIYASNHEDGRVYQIDMAGQIRSTYSHFNNDVTLGPAADLGEPDGLFSALGDRVWAVQSHAGRLYYSVWAQDMGRPAGAGNTVWSVGYVDAAGVPDPATARLEFVVPAYLDGDSSNPVSDLSFAAGGELLISQRSMAGDTNTSAQRSTTYAYRSIGGEWQREGTTFGVGEVAGSAAGGVDHDFAADGYVWMTGDALDVGTPAVVYGLQGTPRAGGDVTVSTLIDFDGDTQSHDKGLAGDVEVPIPEDTMPVPAPG